MVDTLRAAFYLGQNPPFDIGIGTFGIFTPKIMPLDLKNTREMCDCPVASHGDTGQISRALIKCICAVHYRDERDIEMKRINITGLFFVTLFIIAGCATAKIMGGPVAPHVLQDGIYNGEAKNGPVKVEAEVTIQNQRIADIKLTKHRNWKGEAAEEVIPQKIIDEQSTSVDAVSGATASSTAIMNAVEAAIRKSRRE
jgi:uncharacterized protein with FMN-binding domain